MKRLLIADSSPDLCLELTRRLQGQIQICSCSRGEQVLALAESFQPNILLLDLMMPGGDGIGILQDLLLAGHTPKVLAVSRYVSDYMLQELERHKVCYVVRKPCDLRNLAARLLHMAQDKEEGEDLSRKIHEILLTLGLRSNLSGYRYLVEAVELFFKDPEQSMTKELYPAVAARFGATGQQVERAIRGCIQDAYTKRRDELWRLYFPAGRDGRVRSVTNSHFISRIADMLRRQKQEKEDPEI